jgi:hypothetical protein
MDSKDLKGLFEAYNEVYLDEALPSPGTSSGSVTMYGRPRAPYAGTPRNTRFDRTRNAGTPTIRPSIGSLPPSARKVTQYPQGVSTGVGGGNAGGSRSTPTSASRPSSIINSCSKTTKFSNGPMGKSKSKISRCCSRKI